MYTFKDVYFMVLIFKLSKPDALEDGIKLKFHLKIPILIF